MNGMTISFQNVIDGHGIGLTLTGTVIVFFVLFVISLIIGALPYILAVTNKFLPEKLPSGQAQKQSTDDGVVVAIAKALSFHTKAN